MKNGFFSKLTTIVREIGRIGYVLCGKMFAQLRKMSWLQIAAVGVGVALAVVVLYLALFLFLIVMVIKLALVFVFYASGKKEITPHSATEPYTIDMESPPRPNSK